MKQRFLILLILCLAITVFATSIPADAQLKASDMSQNSTITNLKNVNVDLGRNRSVIFEQTLEQADWSCGVSDANSAGPYYHADNFFGLTEPITGFSVTGLCLSYPWEANDEDPMTFDVNFYENNAGTIGDLVVTHEVTLNRELVGVQFSGFDVLQWTGDFPTVVDMAEGWISVVGTSIGTPLDGLLLWANSPDGDLAEFADSGSGWVASTDPLPDRCFTLYGEDTVLAPIENLAVDESTGLLTWDAPSGGGGGESFSDDFEAGVFADGWELIEGPGTAGGGGTPYWHISPDYVYEGSFGAAINWGYTIDTWLITPEIAVEDGYVVSFAWQGSYYWSVDPYDNCDLFIQISTDGGSNWDPIWTFGDIGVWDDWTWYETSLDLSAYAGETVLIGFNEVADDNADTAIDNVYVGSSSGRTLGTYQISEPAIAAFDAKEVQRSAIIETLERDLLGYDVLLDGEFYSYTELLEITLEDLVNGVEYTAGVVAVYDEGDSDAVELTFTYTGTEAGNDIVATTMLRGNYPNPFNPVTNIAYSIQDAGNVTIEVYNLRGQLVKTLVNEVKETGDHTAIWDGTDNTNKSVSSGVYFYKMVSMGSISTYTSSKKMILMK